MSYSGTSRTCECGAQRDSIRKVAGRWLCAQCREAREAALLLRSWRRKSEAQTKRAG